MPTLKDRADGIALWITESTGCDHESVSDIIERMVETDRGALYWQIARRVLPADQIERIESLTSHLIENGYRPDPDEL